VSADPADLANLHDLALPPPVPWWPPPLGWRILAVGLAAVAVILAVRAWARYRADAYRRAAGRELAGIAPEAGAAAMAELLKRTALAAYPRDAVASLTGTAWLEFLDRTGGTTDFTVGPGRILPVVVFSSSHPLEITQRIAIVGCACDWIRKHRRC
jgi:hypothetical protein